MLKRIILSGVLGAVALFAWTFVANGIFGFTARMEMNRIPNERAVYTLLKASIDTPGAYMANPELAADGQFPAGEPVFSIRYSGVGHEAAGRMALVSPVIALAATLLAAALLSVASARVLSRYSYRVLFIAAIGLLLAVIGDLTKFGIGFYPLDTALWIAAFHVVSWTLVGLVMAWTMRPPGDAIGAT